ncbi:Uncharacterized protein GBIM_17417 [Gryllus bimaculatus]|nr:Uncharacterized protein GBIM_17417 [Gryllus bimaculatus]
MFSQVQEGARRSSEAAAAAAGGAPGSAAAADAKERAAAHTHSHAHAHAHAHAHVHVPPAGPAGADAEPMQPQDLKPVECNLCHRKFKNIPALNGHMRLHGGYFKKDSETKKCEKKETAGPPLQTASMSVRALIEEKIIQKRTTNPQLLNLGGKWRSPQARSAGYNL